MKLKLFLVLLSSFVLKSINYTEKFIIPILDSPEKSAKFTRDDLKLLAFFGFCNNKHLKDRFVAALINNNKIRKKALKREASEFLTRLQRPMVQIPLFRDAKVFCEAILSSPK